MAKEQERKVELQFMHGLPAVICSIISLINICTQLSETINNHTHIRIAPTYLDSSGSFLNTPAARGGVELTNTYKKSEHGACYTVTLSGIESCSIPL